MQNILWVAGFAAIAIAVVAIIRTFVLGEAEGRATVSSRNRDSKKACPPPGNVGG